ncbi:hypothetical protein ACJU26_05835 [Acidithiobacillus sp. M4-SHS-6]|uniref:hypothetical protein n=1 Tax=Acidithiobacillus sp. M4-SHS-6 TaxID=3383024 RepID=UPI0039BE625C
MRNTPKKIVLALSLMLSSGLAWASKFPVTAITMSSQAAAITVSPYHLPPSMLLHHLHRVHGSLLMLSLYIAAMFFPTWILWVPYSFILKKLNKKCQQSHADESVWYDFILINIPAIIGSMILVCFNILS